jgi:NADH-quinone oxidoreductase subunit H
MDHHRMELPLQIVQVGISVAFLALYALGAVYAERKVSAYIQDRVGPAEVGPRGILQTGADILKLMLKENIVPTAADKRVFLLAPLVVFVSIFAGFAVLPIGPGWLGGAVSVGLLYIMAIVSIDVIGLLMAGWGSNNKYAYLGGLRSVSQVISYEIPAAMALLVAAMMYGTLDLEQFSLAQGIHASAPVYLFGIWDVTAYGGILSWSVVRYPHLLIALLVYFVAALAECNRAPFDLPEAESELVAGFHSEYSGFRFAVLFLAEYANMFLVGLIAAIVFLGGWNTPLPNLSVVDPAAASQMSAGELLSHGQLAWLTSGVPGSIGAAIWGAFWVLSKGFVSVFIMMWIRWTLPRVRPDQLVRLSWKVLTPVALVLFIVSAIWKLMEVYSKI